MGVRDVPTLRRLPEPWLFAAVSVAFLIAVLFIVGATVKWGTTGLWVTSTVMSATYWSMRCLIEAERRGYIKDRWSE